MVVVGYDAAAIFVVMMLLCCGVVVVVMMFTSLSLHRLGQQTKESVLG